MRKILLLLFTVMLSVQVAVAQEKQQVMINDFEDKPATQSWWRDNEQVTFAYDNIKKHQVNRQSKTCLYVRWDAIPANKPYTWFTGLKAGSLAADGMETTWKAFQQNTWLSFCCKAGGGDSLMLHYLVLSKGHSSKWGSTKMIPAVAGKWTFYKVRFADLQYEDWGRVKAAFDLNSDTGRCFEVGLRSASVSSKGYMEAWFDNIQLTNYEPFE